MKINELDRVHKSILFMMGVAHRLVKDGCMVGEVVSVTATGVSVFDQIEAEGFRPTADEINLALEALVSNGMLNLDDDSSKLMDLTASNWDMYKRMDQ